MLVAISIFVMIVATIATAAFVLAPQIGKGQLIFDLRPDLPRPFGYRMAWLAIRTRDTHRVAECLGLAGTQSANWDTGLGTIYSPGHAGDRLFVSPPVNGWTFVVGLALPLPLGRDHADKATPLLLDLGARFIEVQCYVSHPASDRYAWARIIDGRLVRAFAIGKDGVLWKHGKPTKEEKTMGLKLFQVRGVRGKRDDMGSELLMHPTEEHVMRLAAKWSLDPTRVDQVQVSASLGLIGHAPARWRPELLQKVG